MNVETASTWLVKWKDISFSSLSKDISSDITIIGGGLTGILSAYLLMKEGKKVTLIEKSDFTESATAYTTAFLTHIIDTPLVDLEKMIGKDQTKDVWKSHAEAIDLIEKIVHDEKIECEFTRCDGVMYVNAPEEFESLTKEAKKAKEYGYKVEIGKNDVGFKHSGYISFPRQAKFHPLKFIHALLTILKKNGTQIYSKTKAEKIEDGETLIVKTTKSTITTQHVLIATYDPFNQPLQLFAHKGMYTSYVYELSFPKGKIPEGIYQDQNNPYHYFRVDSGKHEDRIIIGGEDHRHELPIDERKNFRALAEYAASIFTDIPYITVRKWSGPILEPADGLAYIGTFSKDPRKFVALGFSGNGMTYAGITAQMYKDHILKKKNAWEELYNPNRVPTFSQILQKGKDYTGEFIGGAVKNMFK